jgi:glycogen operon protein
MTRIITQGAPEPLGVTLDAEGANVAVFSAHAEAIELCLYDQRGEREIERISLASRSGDVFHAHVAGLREGARYGLRAHGPFDPLSGHRFNPSKLLVDPWALAVDRPFSLHPSMFAYAPDDRADSGPFTPKVILTRPARADAASRPNRPWDETIIYELHVKGFTKRHPGVPEPLRGTFAGLAHDAAIAHLTKLGVTTIEIMPCAAWIDERHLAKLGLSNYWGYNPIAMMAPDPRLAPGGWDEVRGAVARLHEAGLEVIVDVVLNHTGEGDALGPTVCLRGLDNASYYRLLPDDPRHYVNDAGCGNILACDRAPVVRYALDALRAWADYGGVDGFRFDLATTLARRPDGFDANAPLLAAILQDPGLRELKLVAEPWDIGPGGYRLGNFPHAFGEWNDRYRDCARRFWRGDDIGVAELATRVTGSSDFFAARRRPSRGVNFITAHDGFTLADLVSFERKRNGANGEDNRDGTDDNSSWNNGVEGVSNDAAVIAARARDQRNLLASLLLSRGAPMLSMGAELGATQGGANNAYAQDNETTWLDWERADAALIDFTAKLVALRRASRALRRDLFLTGEPFDETLIPDVEWRRPCGAPMGEADWRDGRAATLIACFYAPEEENEEADRLVVVWHRGRENITLTPPPARDGFCWRVALLTSHAAAAEQFGGGAKILVEARSCAALREERAGGARRDSAPTRELLSQLAQAAGIAPQWRDVDGAAHDVPRETILALLARLDLPAATLFQARASLARFADETDRRALPASAVFRDGEDVTLRLPVSNGRRPSGLVVALEDGSEIRVGLANVGCETVSWRGADGRRCESVLARLPRLPLGRHLVTLDGADASCRLTIAPGRCHSPRGETFERGAFGLAAQLYSLRREGDQGVGDFTTLSRLSSLAGGRGAALIALNPLHALFAQNRERASPYYPSDRRFLEPFYLDLRRLDEIVDDALLREALGAEEAAIPALAAAREVDYPGVCALKRRVLERVFAAFDELARHRPDAAPAREFARFVEQGGASLFRFACFETISEARGGGDWRLWPQELRDARGPALAEFARENAVRVKFHQFHQWLCEKQLARAATDARDAGLALGFCRDLAVGAAPDGAESWSNARQLVEGFSIGAPPDPFTRDGQVWGLPPPNPLAWKADGCAIFAELLAANMRHAGALRIDHVMGLARLFVVPDGAPARDGAYLSYPLDELMGQLALESTRANCVVVGEDLGTLPWGFRDKLDAADVLSYKVLWFEREGTGFAPPSHYARKAMACVSTHDLPTLAGWWEGADIAEKAALGLLPQAAAEPERAARLADKRALIEALRREGLLQRERDAAAPLDDELAGAVHAYAARAPSVLAMAQVDDLAGAAVAVNLPGTDRERPNWRRKLALNLDDLFENTRARAVLAGLRRNLV